MGFDYTTQWADFHDALLSGDQRRIRNAVALLHERDRHLEDYLNNLTYTMPFHLTTLSTGLVSDRFYPPEDAHLVKVLASLTASGSSDTVVDVKRNSAAIVPTATVTMGSGVHKGSVAPYQLFDASADDYVDVTCTTAGTGASGLVVLLIFRPVA